MNRLDAIKKHLKPGMVCHRADFKEWSTSVDHDLQELVKEGVLEKLCRGLYHVPRQSVFGKVPADEWELLKTFLKDHRFVLISPNDYNNLGVGTTQLYNERRVYNYKRHGEFKLGNRTFRFIRKSYVPNKVTAELLLVDLVNNIESLAEDQPKLLENIKRRAGEMDPDLLKQLTRDFGTVSIRILFDSLLSNEITPTY